MDFSAKRLYRHFFDLGEGHSKNDEAVRAGIHKLVGQTDRADHPGEEGSSVRTLGEQRNGEMTPKASSPDIIRPYFYQGGRLTVQGISRLAGIGKTVIGSLFSFVILLGALARQAWNWVWTSVGNRIREKEAIRRYLRWGAVGLLGIWLTFFVWNTLSHMLKSTEQPAQRIEIKVLKPLTIQVAAYLKLSHAERYVALLKKKGISARMKKTQAGGKTWYLVRVSEFIDKKSAAEYGNRLKSKKIIDDFFVSNK